jgi:N-acylneuraminate cytidylyltransferase
MSFIALIPMRGGSKSIPNKNIKKFGGKPLCYWVIKAAIESKFITDVYVSSDSDKILKISKSISKKIKIIKRLDKLAKDNSSTEDVLLDFSNRIDFENLITIQATSPFTTSKNIDEAIHVYKKNKLDSLFTAVRSKRFYWNDNIKPINYNPKKRVMRQNFKGTLMENGAFYITKKEILVKHKCRLGGKIGVYEMGNMHSLELDEFDDWNIMSKKIKSKT